VPAFAVTIHKIQGQTLSHAIIGSFRNSMSSIASFSALVRRCAIPMHLLDELKRLQALENRTGASL
jgi:hypothetical protein